MIKEEIIIFVDAWDTVFALPLDEIIRRFLSFGADIVIGAEKNCFPSHFKKEYDRLDSNGSEYKYLNSGVIIGYKDAILEALEAMDAPNLPRDYYNPQTNTNFHFNDQAYFLDLYLRQPVVMKLDYNCLIAQNMQNVEENELDFSHDKIMNLKTFVHPAIFHFNGSSKDKWGREPILKHLGL